MFRRARQFAKRHGPTRVHQLRRPFPRASGAPPPTPFPPARAAGEPPELPGRLGQQADRQIRSTAFTERPAGAACWPMSPIPCFRVGGERWSSGRRPLSYGVIAKHAASKTSRVGSRVLLLYPLARAPRRIKHRATRWRRLLADVADSLFSGWGRTLELGPPAAQLRGHRQTRGIENRPCRGPE